MNVSLTPELEGFINDLVKSGNYFSASEVVREGLRLLKQKQTLRDLQIEELKREIHEGKKAMEEGRYTIINTSEELGDFMENVKRSARSKLEAKKST